MRRILCCFLLCAGTACALERTNGPRSSARPGNAPAQLIGNLPTDVVLILDGEVARPGDLSASAESVRERLRALPADRIDRVEVMKGNAAAALYGPSATQGVIAIFTKR